MLVLLCDGGCWPLHKFALTQDGDKSDKARGSYIGRLVVPMLARREWTWQRRGWRRKGGDLWWSGWFLCILASLVNGAVFLDGLVIVPQADGDCC